MHSPHLKQRKCSGCHIDPIAVITWPLMEPLQARQTFFRTLLVFLVFSLSGSLYMVNEAIRSCSSLEAWTLLLSVESLVEAEFGEAEDEVGGVSDMEKDTFAG